MCVLYEIWRGLSTFFLVVFLQHLFCLIHVRRDAIVALFHHGHDHKINDAPCFVAECLCGQGLDEGFNLVLGLAGPDDVCKESLAGVEPFDGELYSHLDLLFDQPNAELHEHETGHGSSDADHPILNGLGVVNTAHSKPCAQDAYDQSNGPQPNFDQLLHVLLLSVDVCIIRSKQ